jgi:hypothetical protein
VKPLPPFELARPRDAVGVRSADLPITPDKVLAALDAKRAAAAAARQAATEVAS